MTEDQIYKENKRAIRPTELHLRKLKWKYMEKQRELEENHLAYKTTPMDFKQYIFLLWWRINPKNNNEKKPHFLQLKEKYTKFQRNLHKWVDKHKKCGRLCSSICRCPQKSGSAWRSLYSHSQNDSNKNSLKGDPQKMGKI